MSEVFIAYLILAIYIAFSALLLNALRQRDDLIKTLIELDSLKDDLLAKYKAGMDIQESILKGYEAIANAREVVAKADQENDKLKESII